MGARHNSAAVKLRYPLRFFTLLAVGLFSGMAVWMLLAAWPKDSAAPLTAAAVTALAAALLFCCLRALSSGVRLDANFVTVRNFWRTYKISWPEVSHLGDGSVKMGDAGRIWALGVVLRDGRMRNVSTAVGLGPAEIEEIRQAAARYGVPAELTWITEQRMKKERPPEGLYEDPGGGAAVRYWDGSAWSPMLPVSSGKGWIVWKSNPAWTALPAASEPWVHPGIEAAQAGATRAKVWIRACAVVTLALLAAGLVTALWSGNWLWALWAGLFALLPGTPLFIARLAWRYCAELEKRQKALSAPLTSGL